MQITRSLHTTKLLFEVSTNKASNFYGSAFYIGGFNPIISDMHIIHNQHLPGIAGVGKNFLVARHTCIETNFTGGSSGFTKGAAGKKMSIG